MFRPHYTGANSDVKTSRPGVNSDTAERVRTIFSNKANTRKISLRLLDRLYK